MKERVSVSSRPLKGGVRSLFLNYVVHGRRRRENLQLYLIPEKTQLDRIKNGDTLRIANAARDNKEFEIEQMELGLSVRPRPKVEPFKEYAVGLISRYRKAATIANAMSTIKKVDALFPGIFIHEMDSLFFQRLVSSMEREHLRPNTIRKTAGRILAVLRRAKTDNLIMSTPRIADILPRQETVMRDFLTMDEVRRLDATPCESPQTKRAFLFACFTGLRFSDVANLKHENIDGGELSIRMTKTSEPLLIPLTSNAMRYVSDDGKAFVFDCPSLTNVNRILKMWAVSAGINKRLHFHVARHTFATMALSNGADLYTVSKLLGHSNISVTHVYAKVVDESKRKALALIPEL